MSVYYLKENLTIQGVLYKRYSVSPLHGVSDKAIAGLMEQKRIREIVTPPLSTFEPLKKHAKLLAGKGINTLGDFAFADFSTMRGKLKDELSALQGKAKSIINPDLPLNAEDCGCGESPMSLPVAE